MKKYFAELVGTMVLVLMGCGTATSLQCGTDMASVVGTALAFGLSVVPWLMQSAAFQVAISTLPSLLAYGCQAV